MATWNSAFELIPVNNNDPGFGAQNIRELKAEIRGRLEVEHFFGANEDSDATLYGRHKEGSARATSLDNYTGNADRDPELDDQTKVGRIVIDTQDRIPADEKLYDGQDSTEIPAKFDTSNNSEKGLDDRYRKIKALVYDEATGGTPSWKTIFDIDDIVDVKFDQTIDGRKTFILEPKIPDPAIDVGGTDYGSDWFVTQLDAASADEKRVATNLHNVRVQLISMLLADVLNPSSSLATYLESVDDTYIDDTTGFIGRTIKVNNIEADSIKGVVWV